MIIPQFLSSSNANPSILAYYFDYSLLIFSIVLAFISFYTIFLIAERLNTEWRENKIIWIITGTFSFGIGLSAMHFLGIASMEMDAKMYYSPFFFGLFIFSSLIFSSLILFIGRKNISFNVTSQHVQANIKKQVYRQTLLVFLPMLALVGIVSVVAFFVHDSIKRSENANEAMAQADLIANLVVNDFDAIVEELLYRAEDPLIKEFLVSPSSEVKVKLISELIALAKVKKIFNQIRVLSVQGQEKIRIDSDNGEPIAIAEQKLQDKSHRYYFEQLKKLDQGVVYVSPFDLNVENEQVEIPLNPMIRFATPIYDDSGIKLGIIMFNYFGKLILNDIKNQMAKSNSKVFLLNSQGYYLIGPSSDKEWGFMFNQESTFKQDFPHAWDTINGNESGHFEVESSLFSFITVGAVSGKNAGSVSRGETERWKVILYLPTPAWVLSSVFEHMVSIIFFSILLIITLFIAWSTALNSVHRKMAEKDKQNTLNELNFMKYALDEHAIVSITNAKGEITYINERFIQISGYSQAELLGKTHSIIKSGTHSTEFYQQMWQTIANGQTWHGIFQNRAKNGAYYWVQSTIVPELDDQGIPHRYISIRTDITRQKNTEKEISKLFQAVESSASIVMVTDVNGIIEYINPAFTQITGYTATEVIGQKTSMLRSGMTSAETYHKLWDTIHSGQTWRGEFRNKCKDGHYYWAATTISPVIENGQITHFTGIQQDITERKHMEDQLKQKQIELKNNLRELTESQIKLKEQAKIQIQLTEKAEKADRAKSEFLSAMSHELRTPLNSILGFAQVFEYKSEQALTKTQKTCVDHIIKGGKHLLELINEILDLTKIESGKMQLSIENMHLYSVVDECLYFLGSIAENKQIEINWAENDPLFKSKEIQVETDHMRLKQVIINLLSNAIKYNHINGKITLSSESQSKDFVRLIISDTGPGIPEEKYEILFEPFTRLEKLNSNIEGTGIGLSLSKKIMDLLGGNIGVKSTIGQGSSFWIDIPKAKVKQNNVISPWTDSADYAMISDDKEVIGKVLYIEDNPASISLMEQLVNQISGLQLLSAQNAELGLNLAKQHQPDMIILDINLPGMSGLEAVTHLKHMQETQHIPVIALSANAMPADIQRGLHAGFKQYLTKPLDINSMIDTIKETLEVVE